MHFGTKIKGQLLQMSEFSRGRRFLESGFSNKVEVNKIRTRWEKVVKKRNTPKIKFGRHCPFTLNVTLQQTPS